MSQHDGSSISIFTASDDTDASPRETPRQRRAARRRDRHQTRRLMHAAESTPIRRLLQASA